MFKLKLDDANNFKKSIKTLNNLITEGKFQIDEEGVRLRAMDPSQIAMVDFNMPKSAFTEFESQEETTLGINLGDLNDRTKTARTEDTLQMSLTDSGSRLKLTFQGKIKREFDQPLLDLSQDTPDEPSVQYDSKIKINGSTLKSNLKDANLVSSHVKLETTPEELKITAKGDKGNLNTTIHKDDDVVLEYDVDGEEKAMFPIDYLNNILSGATSSSIVTLQLKTDAPLKLRYGIGDATFTYFLAPRVEEQ